MGGGGHRSPRSLLRAAHRSTLQTGATEGQLLGWPAKGLGAGSPVSRRPRNSRWDMFPCSGGQLATLRAQRHAGGKGPGGGSWSILPVSQRRSTGSHRLASGGASIGRLHSATCHKGCQFRGQPQPPSWKDEEGQEKGPKEGPATRWCLGPGPNPPSLPVSPWGGLGEGHLESFQMKGSRWPHTHPPRSPWPERFQMLTPAQAPRPQL